MPASYISSTVPKCTINIQNGAITGTCTFLHMAACFVSCDRFYRPGATDNKITCDHGQWNMPVPCLFSGIDIQAYFHICREFDLFLIRDEAGEK